jgi:acylphosphatase
MVDLRAIRAVVSGRVQGVAYRASFRREAMALELAGWVRNRSDGTVEFLVQGRSDRVRKILEWARNGPSLARVTDLSASDVAYDSQLSSFEIRYRSSS